MKTTFSLIIITFLLNHTMVSASAMEQPNELLTAQTHFLPSLDFSIESQLETDRDLRPFFLGASTIDTIVIKDLRPSPFTTNKEWECSRLQEQAPKSLIQQTEKALAERVEKGDQNAWFLLEELISFASRGQATPLYILGLPFRLAASHLDQQGLEASDASCFKESLVRWKEVNFTTFLDINGFNNLFVSAVLGEFSLENKSEYVAQNLYLCLPRRVPYVSWNRGYFGFAIMVKAMIHDVYLIGCIKKSVPGHNLFNFSLHDLGHMFEDQRGATLVRYLNEKIENYGTQNENRTYCDQQLFFYAAEKMKRHAAALHSFYIHLVEAMRSKEKEQVASAQCHMLGLWILLHESAQTNTISLYSEGSLSKEFAAFIDAMCFLGQNYVDSGCTENYKEQAPEVLQWLNLIGKKVDFNLLDTSEELPEIERTEAMRKNAKAINSVFVNLITDTGNALIKHIETTGIAAAYDAWAKETSMLVDRGGSQNLDGYLVLGRKPLED